MFVINFFKSAFDWLGFFNKSANIVFLGLDNAGKSTMLYMLQFDKFAQQDSTQHAHNAEITIGNIQFNSYDLGGHKQARRTWSEYCGTLDGLIYIVDTSDHDRLEESRAELEKLLNMEELAEVPIVIFGNKIDKKESISEDELREALGLPHHLTFGRNK